MKKRILFLIPNLVHGGAERVLVNLVNNIDKKRYDITVQTLFDLGINKQYLSPDIRYIGGWKWQPRGNSHLLKIFPATWLYRYLVRESYDIVVSYLEGPTARIVSGCPDLNTKKVCWIHIELESRNLAAVGFRSPSEAESCYNRYDQIITVANSVLRCFAKSMNPSVPMRVLYNTNETEFIRSASLTPPDDLNFTPQDCISICSVAKLASTKGFDRLINAHKRLIDEGFLHKVYIIGTGEDQKFLEEKIHQYGVEQSFILLGFKENPYQYVSRCSLYVCSSRREGFSTAVTEALIVGTPVVSTNCSGAKELLGENDEYGLVVDNSEEGVYEGMKKMLSNPALLAHYKEKAKERGGFFSREQTVKAVEDMFERL